MNEFIGEGEKRTPVTREVDVLVCGIGPAGFSAAVSAGRGGVNTLAVERYGFLGGGLTAQNVTSLPMYTLVPVPELGITKPLAGGVYSELVKRLAKIGGAILGEDVVQYSWKGKLRGVREGGSIMTNTDSESMKYMCQEMFDEAGVKLLAHTMVVNAIVENNIIKGVIIENKSGRQAILAKVIVDCTGDGDIFSAAGAPYEQTTGRARPGHISTLGLTLEWRIAGVDMEKAFSCLKDRRKMDELLEKAYDKGEIPEPGPDMTAMGEGIYKRGHFGGSLVGSLGVFPYPYKWLRKGESLMWGPSTSGDVTNAADLTEAEIDVREKALPYLNWFRKNVPGFEEAYIAYTPAQIGIRESRRVVGEYILTGRGDIYRGKRHKDVVARIFRWTGDTPLTEEEPLGPLFDIPYRCLVPLQIDNLLVAGRCISIDHRAATFWEPREESSAMILGDVAGTAAALCVKNDVKPRYLDVKMLQRALVRKGFNLYEPTEYV